GTPPVAHGGPRKIRQYASTRPDDGYVGRSVGKRDVGSARETITIDGPGAINLEAQVDDRHHLETLGGQRVEQALWLRETLGVEGEVPISIHVMDVEMNHVGGDAAPAEFAREIGDHRTGVIAVAALMVAQRPARR